jgi:hypothetical protein
MTPSAAAKAAARQRAERRAILERGLLACYEIIDGARKEMAELDAADKAASIRASEERTGPKGGA